MSHPVPLDDFRALRYVLDTDEFAVSSGKPDPPPFDLIKAEDWENLMHLASDVSIRTSSWRGSIISSLLRLSDDWSSLIEVARIEEPLFQMMLSVSDDLSASIFNLVHGYYRQAASALRSALELVVIGADCQQRGGLLEIEAWRSGAKKLRLGTSCERILSEAKARQLDMELLRQFGKGLLGNGDPSKGGWPGWTRELFRELSYFTHSRPGFTDGDLWSSNGPVFVKGAIDRVTDLFQQAFSVGLLVTKIGAPDLKFPESAKSLWGGNKAWRPMARAAAKRLNAWKAP
jgi:hypothetical protein